MNDKNEIGESLNELENNMKNNKLSLKIKILISVLIILLILFITSSIILFILYKNEKDKSKEEKEEKDDNMEYLYEINGFREKWYDIYGNRTMNISYAENGKIKNTYKINGTNYKEEIGNVNGGYDYPENEQNIYDLYIPFSALQRKNKSNGIILFIHGGAFVENTKEEQEVFAERYAKQGYITANIEYTLLLDKYKVYNIYRILDEITACIKHIKKELESQGFDGEKLELALSGISAGSQLTLLYGYSDKNKIIPIKFLVNSVGPISMEDKYWRKLAEYNNTFDSIENKTFIEESIQSKKLVEMDNYFLLKTMNLFLGKKYSEKEIGEMIENNKINYDNENYKEMVNLCQYSFPINLVGENPIPVLCLYGGNDDLIGLAHYCYLKEKYVDLKKEENIYLVYMRYAGHERFHHGAEQSINEMKNYHYKIIDFAKKYFTSD